MTEATTLPVSAHRDCLISAGARLVLPQHSDLLRAFNKEENHALWLPRSELLSPQLCSSPLLNRHAPRRNLCRILSS